jgi:hypothetical protein
MTEDFETITFAGLGKLESMVDLSVHTEKESSYEEISAASDSTGIYCEYTRTDWS